MRKRPPQPQRLERGAPRERRSAALPARGHGAPQRPRADTAQMTARRGGCGNSWRRSGRGDGARGAADMPDRARPAVRLGSARRSGPIRTAPDRPRSSARRSRPSGQGRAGPGSAAAAGAVSARGRPRPGAQRRPPAPTGPYLTQTRRRPSSAAWRRRWRPGWSPRTTSW